MDCGVGSLRLDSYHRHLFRSASRSTPLQTAEILKNGNSTLESRDQPPRIYFSKQYGLIALERYVIVHFVQVNLCRSKRLESIDGQHCV